MQYVRFLPVPVVVNGHIISQESFADTIAGRATGFEEDCNPLCVQQIQRDAPSFH